MRALPRNKRMKEGATANWPTKYRAQYWSQGTLAYRATAIMFLVGTLKSSTNMLKVFGGLAVAAVVGGLIGAVTRVPGGWLVFALATIVLTIAGGVAAIISYPRRSGMFDWYRPGTVSRIAVANGILMLSLNSHVSNRPVDSVIRVWRFGDLSAIEFSDRRSVVVPTVFVPHRVASGAGREIFTRWTKPNRQQ
jgi:hypothetical protein